MVRVVVGFFDGLGTPKSGVPLGLSFKSWQEYEQCVSVGKCAVRTIDKECQT